MRRSLILATATLSAALLAGCGASSQSSPDLSLSSSSAVPMSEEAGFSADMAVEDAAAYSGDESGEQIITTGFANVTTDDPNAALTQLAQKVSELGGTVANSSQWTSGDRPYAEATVRVPSAELQDLVDWLPELGALDSQSTQSEDVTTQITDLGARIAALETSITRLTELMGDAETTADLLEAEDMLTQRQAELDSLNSTLEYLSDQVALSTLTVSFSTTPSSPGPSISWGEAWDNFVSSVFWLLNAIVFALPWIILVAILFFAIRGVRRWKKSRAIRSEHVTELSQD